MKPDTCRPCPRYAHSSYMELGTFPEGAKLLVVTLSPSVPETETLKKTFIPLAGENIEEVAFDCVLRCKSTTALSEKAHNEAVRHCAQYDHIPSSIEVVTLVGPGVATKFYPSYNASTWEGHILPIGETL